MISDYYDYQNATRKTMRVPPEQKAVPDTGDIQKAYGTSLAQRALDYQLNRARQNQFMAEIWQNKKDLDNYANANTVASIISAGNIGVEASGGAANLAGMDEKGSRGLENVLKKYEAMKDRYRRTNVNTGEIVRGVDEGLDAKHRYRKYLVDSGLINYPEIP